MNEKQKPTRISPESSSPHDIVLTGVVAYLIIVLICSFSLGIDSQAFASGETFSPALSTTLTAAYDGSNKTLQVSGTVVDGSETFATQADCFGGVPKTYFVTGPETPHDYGWTITGPSPSTTVLGSGASGGPVNLSPVLSPTKVFGYVCGGTSRQSPLMDNYATSGNYNVTSTPIDVSSYVPGTYTFTTTITGVCIVSFGTPAGSCDTPPPDVTSTTFTIPVPAPTGTINVTADRTAKWQITGTDTGASFSGSGTSGGPYTAPADTYTMIDPTTQSSPYGFIDNPTYSLIGTPNIFASLIKTAEASSCGGWVCDLSASGAVHYDLTTTTCSVSVESSVNGNITNLSSLPIKFAGPLNNYSYTSTPQAPYSIADASGSTFTLTLPSTGTWGKYTTDYVGTDVTSNGTVTSYSASTLSPNPDCAAGGSLTFVAKYLTRATLLVQ